MKGIARSSLVAALLTATVAVQTGQAQDIRYTRISKTELGGMMGAFSPLMGGMSGDQGLEEVTLIKGTQMRTDAGDDSVILDFESGSAVAINHPSRSYSRFNLSDFAAYAESASASTGQQTPGQPMPGVAEGVEYDVRVSSDHTGERMELLGFEAEQVFVTVHMIPTAESDPDGRAGPMALLTELWFSEEFPGGRALDELAASLPDQMGGTFTIAQSAGGAAQMLGMNAQIEVAMEQSQETLAELGSLPMKQTMWFVRVPAGQEFDRAAALGAGEQGGGSMADLMAEAMRGGSPEEMRRRLEAMGLPGAAGGEPPDPTAAPTVQTTMLKVIEEITDFEMTELDGSHFEPPSDYTERTGN